MSPPALKTSLKHCVGTDERLCSMESPGGFDLRHRILFEGELTSGV
jgi:hypothetical protein